MVNLRGRTQAKRNSTFDGTTAHRLTTQNPCWLAARTCRLGNQLFFKTMTFFEIRRWHDVFPSICINIIIVPRFECIGWILHDGVSMSLRCGVRKGFHGELAVDRSLFTVLCANRQPPWHKNWHQRI